MRGKLVGSVMLACGLWAGTACSTVLNWGVTVVNTAAIEQTFAFVLLAPASIFGPVDTRLSFGVAVGDGARDGATVNIGSGAPALAQGSLVQGFTPTSVATAGAAQSFAAEGGTAGAVTLLGLSVNNTTAIPSTFLFSFGNPNISLDGRNLVQSTLARAFADGEIPDGGSIVAVPATQPDVMQTTVGNVGNPVLTLDLGVDTPFAPDAGVFGPENASGVADCSGGCSLLTNRASFTLSAFDLAGMILRSEIGGSELLGPVAWTFAASDNGSFDCGAIGCDNLRVDLNFTLTPGDALTFVGRFDVEPAAAVPEPASAGLLALGLAMLGYSRKARSGRRRSA